MYLSIRALEMRDEFKKLIKTYEISEAGLIEQFVKQEKEQIGEIEFITIWKYINQTTIPGWLFGSLLDFLTKNEKYDSPILWEFVQKWAGPYMRAAGRIETRIKIEIRRKVKEKERLLRMLENLEKNRISEGLE